MSSELRKYVIERVDDEYGLDIPALFIVNISLPEAVEKALDTRTSMGVIGDMGKFQAYQMGNAMEAAANNPAGGGAAEGMGLGMGFAMANRMAGAAGPQQAGYPQAPPPPPQATAWHIAVNGQTSGPYNDQQLTQKISSGEIAPTTTVWCAGMSGWLPAAKVPQLAAYFPQSPPPPPPV